MVLGPKAANSTLIKSLNPDPLGTLEVARSRVRSVLELRVWGSGFMAVPVGFFEPSYTKIL